MINRGDNMKITCSYCGAMFNDTMEKCPSCGADNHGVVRTVSDQPLTIPQLEEWYRSKGLPPYETTRFFIGIDYKKPKAFGIYQDTASGNFVVYKNKASGERSIRYEGTDEAYAVNELFQRLKQEIIQQKAANVKKSGENSSSYDMSYMKKGSSRRKKTSGKGLSSLPEMVQTLVAVGSISAVGLTCILVSVANIPSKGYYSCDNEIYYHITDSERTGWYKYYGSDKWQQIDMEAVYPDIYNKKSAAKKHLISEDYVATLPCSDITLNIVYEDYLHANQVNVGYYSYDDTTYYHMSTGQYDDWYYYDDHDGWLDVGYDSIPEDLTHSTIADDFYFTPVWDSSTQFSDFMDSDAYYAYAAEHSSNSDWDDDDDYDYDWDSNDSWDYGDIDWDSDW